MSTENGKFRMLTSIVAMLLHHLIYSSTANINLTEAELHRLLDHWRIKNTQLGITGLLLYSEGHILQVLEGDADVVYSLYATIAADPRHRSLIKLADGPVADRAFADWSMQMRTVDSADFTRIVLTSNSMPEHIGNLLPLLEAFMAEVPL